MDVDIIPTLKSIKDWHAQVQAEAAKHKGKGKQRAHDW
jgi:hypothetical protein